MNLNDIYGTYPCRDCGRYVHPPYCPFCGGDVSKYPTLKHEGQGGMGGCMTTAEILKQLPEELVQMYLAMRQQILLRKKGENV